MGVTSGRLNLVANSRYTKLMRETVGGGGFQILNENVVRHFIQTEYRVNFNDQACDVSSALGELG